MHTQQVELPAAQGGGGFLLKLPFLEHQDHVLPHMLCGHTFQQVHARPLYAHHTRKRSDRYLADAMPRDEFVEQNGCLVDSRSGPLICPLGGRAEEALCPDIHYVMVWSTAWSRGMKGLAVAAAIAASMAAEL